MEGARMLVLTRKMGEAISIGDTIKIKIVEIKGNQVRLGIDAPVDLRILREEIYAKVQSENLLAADWNLSDFRKVMDSFTKGNEDL
jgi:carbon storage regulator